jgi:hypothetical protein
LILLAIGAVPVSNATRAAFVSLGSASSDVLILENTDALASGSSSSGLSWRCRDRRRTRTPPCGRWR